MVGAVHLRAAVDEEDLRAGHCGGAAEARQGQGYHWESCRCLRGGGWRRRPRCSSCCWRPRARVRRSAGGSTSTEEEIYLDVDGTATVNVNASVPSLVALRGADLPVDPQARLDRDQVRAFFSGPGATVTRVSLSRRDGRRFVHVSIEVDDVRRLSKVPPFAWSSYRLDRRDDALEFRQVVGAAAGKPVGDVGWSGDEAVRFRVHVPSEIPFHNSRSGVERGNILGWDQPLAERAEGAPLEMEFQMQPESILYSTLLLFGGTIVAAGLAFAIAIWLLVRRGRRADIIESAR